MTQETRAAMKAKIEEKWSEATVVGRPVQGLDAITDAKDFIEETEVPQKRKTLTNWNMFYEAGLKPTYIKCDGYLPMHPYNNGCHTSLNLDPKVLFAHIDGEHGGGFFITFKNKYQQGGEDVHIGQPWEGWKAFEEAGLELRDFRCDVCNEEVKLTARSVIRHIKPHSGKSSRIRKGGDFLITLGREALLDQDEE